MDALNHTSTSAAPPGIAMERFTLTELRRLQEDVEKAIARQREASQAEALATIARLVREAELTPDRVMEHLTAKRSRKRRKLPPKYRNPDRPEQTWAGRGKRPNWLERRLASGATIEQFEIARQGELHNATS